MPSDRPPNILLITSDQQHFTALGTTNPAIKTPALDRLCNEGVRFDRAYCPNPTCTPTRASIITGMYPSMHGAWSLGTRLPESVPTVGDMLRTQGYDSTLVGKAHFQPLDETPEYPSIERQPLLRDLDFWRKFRGPWYGFDNVETSRMHSDESHVGGHYAIWMEEKGLSNWRDYFQPWPPPDANDKAAGGAGTYFLRDKRAWALPAEFHHTTWVAERTIANIEASAARQRPFFLWSSFFDPHPPYIIPEPWASMYKPEDVPIGAFTPGEFDKMPPHFGKTREVRPDYAAYREPNGGAAIHGFHSHLRDEAELRKDVACYYGMVSFMDQQIGRILDRLDAMRLADDTLIVFTSDHGHFIGQHGLIGKGPFHYEDVIRVPFIVRWPGGGVPKGRSSVAMQSLVDLTPTFLSAAGRAKPPGSMMQGVDLLPSWRAPEDTAAAPRDHVIVENRHNPTTVHLRTYVDARYKLTVYRAGDDGEMFDLLEDPGEVRNLWGEPSAAGIKQQLMLKMLQAEMVREPMPMPRISNA
ncbi:MAG TPA: sulfatase-like hydrolase/transferase [Tepidisphaeraceae bacterium]|jgi:arylsulfatase A-like enzyme|nr:sulfatase-like hydrolase/transferase [Tepidisphaeraceae bacterium]